MDIILGEIKQSSNQNIKYNVGMIFKNDFSG